jgi:hypothetical protein
MNLAKMFRFRIFGIFKILLPLILLSACSRQPDEETVVGTYVARHSSAIETLILDRSGNYTLRVRTTDGGERSITDKWKFEPYGGDPKIVLYNFETNFDRPYPLPKIAKGAIVLLSAENSQGRMRLYVNYDLNQYYEKE